MSKDDAGQATGETIDLKEPGLAAFLAWLVPGLGHWYQGRTAKAVLYFVCIMGLFSYGVYLSSSNEPCRDGTGTIGYGRAVYFSFRDGDWRLSYLGQVGAGLPSLPALLQASRVSNHRKVWWGGFMAPPRLDIGASSDHTDPNFDQPTLGDLHRQLHHYFDLASFFTTVAGLLNILVIYDAWAGPVIVTQPAKKEEQPEESPEAAG